MIRPALTLPAAALCALAGLATTFVPAPAAACGGFFCDGQNLTPVDQNAERVLFEVPGDGTVTATVEISFTGNASDFSWVVPVPDTPTLDIVPPSTLQLLDAATSPLIRPPSIEYPAYDGDSAVGDDDDAAADDDDATGDDDDDTGGTVDVDDLPQVGPFDPQVISSTDPGALVDWLNDNGYLITPEMEPAIANYVMSGMKFLGMKMAPEAGVADIAPIRMTYPANEPVLPLVLTSVAAEPEMSVIVFVAGNSTYASSNYSTLPVDQAALQADPRTGANNYYSLLSWQADQAGGRAFFLEFSGTGNTARNKLNGVFLNTSDEGDARQQLSALLSAAPRVTRLYARISPSEMTADPAFTTISAVDVDNLVDLRERPAVWWDQAELPTPPCGDTYCGKGSCATATTGDEGCVCNDGFAARRIESPAITNLNGFQARPRVTCQDRDFDMMASMDINGSGAECSWSCGGFGTCERIGSMPTCVCDEGYVAVPVGGFLTPEPLTCRPIERVYDVSQLLWPNWPFGPTPEPGEEEAPNTEPAACAASGAPSSTAPLALLLGLAGMGLRRRAARK